MLTAKSVVEHSHAPCDTITLDETARHRRRIKLVSDAGLEFLLDLPAARLLKHGEALVLDDGRMIEVRAEPESLLEIRANNSRHLLTLAWQIGNRHLAAQIEQDRIVIRKDDVNRTMLEGLDATVNEILEPFTPEGGAYGDAHASHHHE